jgi:hypothetical protein
LLAAPPVEAACAPVDEGAAATGAPLPACPDGGADVGDWFINPYAMIPTTKKTMITPRVPLMMPAM